MIINYALILPILFIVGCGPTADLASLISENVDFGEVETGTSATKNLVVKNPTSNIPISSISFALSSLASPFRLIDKEACSNIEPEKTCSIKVQFSPIVKDVTEESVIISYIIDGTAKQIIVILKGAGSVSSDDKNWLLTNLPRPNLNPYGFNPQLKTRWDGIHNLKYDNPRCYLAYAHARIKNRDPYEAIRAMERLQNPRPLVFTTDADWEEFKKDLIDVFTTAQFNGANSYIIILGTSTTFFSLNPTKGESARFLEKPPECEQSAQNPATTTGAYAFDAEGIGKSDLDIHIFIPELSNTCYHAFKNAKSDGGNSGGTRDTFFQNTLAECFKFNIGAYAAPAAARAMYDTAKKTGLNEGGNRFPWKKSPGNVKNLSLGDKIFGDFMNKWTVKLKNREINFSVHIRPDQKKGAKHGEPTDFNDNPYVKTSAFKIAVP